MKTWKIFYNQYLQQKNYDQPFLIKLWYEYIVVDLYDHSKLDVEWWHNGVYHFCLISYSSSQRPFTCTIAMQHLLHNHYLLQVTYLSLGCNVWSVATGEGRFHPKSPQNYWSLSQEQWKTWQHHTTNLCVLLPLLQLCFVLWGIILWDLRT